MMRPPLGDCVLHHAERLLQAIGTSRSGWCRPPAATSRAAARRSAPRGAPMPALLNSRSRRPKRVTTASNSAATEAGLRHVGGHGERALGDVAERVAGLGDRLLQRVGAPAGEGHAPAVGQQRQRAGGADAGAGAGDECDAVVGCLAGSHSSVFSSSNGESATIAERARRAGPCRWRMPLACRSANRPRSDRKAAMTTRPFALR